MDGSILIVDDDEDLRELLGHALRGDVRGQVFQAASAADARALLAERRFDVVVTDLSMPGEDGLSLMRQSLETAAGPPATWIVLTGYGTFDAAVEALQLGASDFFQKPLLSLEPLRNAVRNALDHQRMRAERDRLHRELEATNERLRKNVGQLNEACRLLQHQADTIQSDLHRAGIIQRALLPHTPPQLADCHFRALYRPSQKVGGDLYDIIQLDERRVALLVADAAGHGLSAAMLAVLFRSQLPLVDPVTRTPCDPCDVLNAANRSLCEAFPTPGLFLTAAYCLLDTERHEATIASAGHPPLLWMRSRGGVERVFHTGPALGLSLDAHFAQIRIALDPDDALIFYSDGLYELFSDDVRNPSEKIAAALETAANRE